MGSSRLGGDDFMIAGPAASTLQGTGADILVGGQTRCTDTLGGVTHGPNGIVDRPGP